MVKSGLSQSRSESRSRSPAIKGSQARRSDNTTLVNSPDDARQLASAKTTSHHPQDLSSASLSQRQLPVKKNHRSSIDKGLGDYKSELDFDEEEYESSIESCLCSASQMSLSAFSSDSDNTTRRIEQLGKKLVALTSSHNMSQFNAQARLETHGIDSSQYNNYLQRIEEKRMEMISVNQRIAYKRSLLDADDNPTMNASKKVSGQLLLMKDDRTDIPSGIIDN